MRHDAVILHAGPMNRGVEISDQVADSSRALVLEQVRNGVPTRMAVLGTIGSRL
jgi:aspartate carbamoyltransferase catalytic subunit